VVVAFVQLIPRLLDYSLIHIIVRETAIVIIIVAVVVVVIVLGISGLFLNCQWSLNSLANLAVPFDSWRATNS
jgi:hypothetical protein